MHKILYCLLLVVFLKLRPYGIWTNTSQKPGRETQKTCSYTILSRKEETKETPEGKTKTRETKNNRDSWWGRRDYGFLNDRGLSLHYHDCLQERKKKIAQKFIFGKNLFLVHLLHSREMILQSFHDLRFESQRGLKLFTRCNHRKKFWSLPEFELETSGSIRTFHFTDKHSSFEYGGSIFFQSFPPEVKKNGKLPTFSTDL